MNLAIKKLYNRINRKLDNQMNNEEIINFQLDSEFQCARIITPAKDRFELEYNLDNGSSYNTFIINNEKQFIIKNPEIFDFIVKRIERSYQSIYNLVNRLDNFSLQKKRQLTIPLIKEIL